MLRHMSTKVPKKEPLDQIEQKFLHAIEHHIRGWRQKIDDDFGVASYEKELENLRSDPVYSKFGLDCPEYVLVRLMGRMSISVGRRLGEMYDKLPRFLAAARFNVTSEQVAEKFDGLEIDIGLRYSLLSQEDRIQVASALTAYGADGSENGVGIEIRYNFNPNDSARLRKDVDMARHVQAAGLFPLYLIYSSISPRDDAIARLTRGGWQFVQGNNATNFTRRLFGADFLGILDRPDLQARLHKEIHELLVSIFHSYAFSQVAASKGDA